MTRYSSFLLSILLLAVIPSCSFAGPVISRPGYWIEKMRSPGKLILTGQEIEELNRSTLEYDDQMAEIGEMPDSISGGVLWGWLNEDFIPVKERYYETGEVIGNEFFIDIVHNMNLDGVVDANGVMFGLVTGRADVRAFPAQTHVLKSPERVEFDTFQYSSLPPGEPVALLHTSRDGLWGFFQTRTVRGWISLDRVAFGKREEVSMDGDFLVITGSMVDIYPAPDAKETLSTVPMGSVYYLSGSKNKGWWAVKYPSKGIMGEIVWKEGFISKSADVSMGFLPYTRRNVVSQAFKMLGEEYGWGGREGKRDCSEFIKDLFASMGIRLPRNSGRQGLTGMVRAHVDGLFTRDDISSALDSAESAITLIGTEGHIMLYLGKRNGRPYVIHQIFGYMGGSGLKIVNKVAVTDLNIGSRSKNGPLKDRIKSINAILPPKSMTRSAIGLNEPSLSRF